MHKQFFHYLFSSTSFLSSLGHVEEPEPICPHVFARARTISSQNYRNYVAQRHFHEYFLIFQTLRPAQPQFSLAARLFELCYMAQSTTFLVQIQILYGTVHPVLNTSPSIIKFLVESPFHWGILYY